MTFAVLGLGIIGSAWARNLIEDGHDVRAWNRTPQPDFPGFVPELQTAVSGADVLILVVADPPAVQSVLDGALPHLKPGALLVQSSTISPHWTREFASQVERAGARFLEAPFTGSKLAAQARETVFYLGGENALVEEATPILQPLSKTILHIGELGTASALKLAMNLNIAGVAQTLSESLQFARANGLSDELFFQALDANVSKSGVSELKKPKLIEGDYSPQFSLKHMGKDLRLTLETAQENGTQLPQTQKLRELYERGLAQGLGDDDFIGLIRLLQVRE
jgi:3-hydroxyisobutyrate dehydrogenase-like beta-hydroxyacid dehydrogenase